MLIFMPASYSRFRLFVRDALCVFFFLILELSNGDCYVPLTKTCNDGQKCKVDVENVICLARLGNFGFRAQCVQVM